jgi:hypothetical protein
MRMVVVSKGKFCLSIGHQNYKSPKKKVQRPQFEKVLCQEMIQAIELQTIRNEMLPV